MKKVLLITDGIFHPPTLARKALSNALAEVSDIDYQHINSMKKLPGNLKDFSAIVLYFHHKKISEIALATLDEFVSNGGGILGVHTATASFKQQVRYFEILGGRFVEHGKVEGFEVQKVNKEIFDNIGNFVVKDELYFHELQPGINVHFIAKYGNKDVPAVWTNQHGRGRVFYAMPGHTTATMRNKIYQKLLQRGLAWVCRE